MYRTQGGMAITAHTRAAHEQVRLDTRTTTAMCEDAQASINNKLHLNEDEEAPVVTLEYGPYMN